MSETSMKLMADASAAVFAVEIAMSKLCTAYAQLLIAEQAIADSNDADITKEDKVIAKRGAENAAFAMMDMMALGNN